MQFQSRLLENLAFFNNLLTRKTVRNGPGVCLVGPFRRAHRRKGVTLLATQVIRVKNTVTGEVVVHQGPQLFFPGPDDELSKPHDVHVLRHNEYMKILDKLTGISRIERGEKHVVLGPNETVVLHPTAGINVDEHTAVLVRNTRDGSLRLETEPQVFIPAHDEEIEEIREKILLEEHESVIIKEKNGNVRIVRGRDLDSTLFLQPYEELVTLRWSSGIHKDSRELRIIHIDERPKFMWYEFEVRTRDNVELVLGTTFFWQISDITEMIRTTDDAPGDLCSHARSMIIQSISKVTLEQFLDAFNDIVKQCVLGREDDFYGERGIRIHSVEVRSISCKNESTEAVLQEIIRETTDRLHRLQKQQSENEIELNRVQGRIEAEKRKNELIRIESENRRQEAEVAGEGEALRARIFFTPRDVDLSIEARTGKD